LQTQDMGSGSEALILTETRIGASYDSKFLK